LLLRVIHLTGECLEELLPSTGVGLTAHPLPGVAAPGGKSSSVMGPSRRPTQAPPRRVHPAFGRGEALANRVGSSLPRGIVWHCRRRQLPAAFFSFTRCRGRCALRWCAPTWIPN
jgi:hypothetical protein